MSHLRPACVLILLFTLLTGVALPAAMTAIGGVLFPTQAGGSLISRDGHVVGSALLGQSFTQDRYFQGRPSATSETDPKDSSKTISVPYLADNSAGSNLGPTSKALLDRITGDIAKADAAQPGPRPVPADAVTSSASGLDPDISPQNAARQVARVAAARRLPEARVRELLAAHTEGRALGIVGEPHVNVLALNLALDALQ